MTRPKNLPECLLKLNSGYCAQISSCNPCIGLVILDTFGIIYWIPKYHIQPFSLGLAFRLCQPYVNVSAAQEKKQVSLKKPWLTDYK
jgi:hypothetical protein